MIDELKCAIAVTQIVKSDRLGKEIIANASHLHGVWSEELATIDEASSLKGYWVISLIHDEHADDSLITINYEVAAELMHVFLLLDQLLLGEAVEVAVL